jgi:hypothetical protein
MINFVRITALCLGVIAAVSCGPTGNMNQTASTETKLAAEELEFADESATLGLAGQGDRICRLNYQFVRKDAVGNYSIVGSGSTSDGTPRSGFGRGCLNYCVSAFDSLMTANQPNGIEILVNSCQFAQTSQPAVSRYNTTLASCKVVQADQKVIFAESKTRADCASECAKFETTNPGRRCEWGAEVLRAHPVNQCVIRGGAGRLLYQASTTRFSCRTECSARATTNPNRSCLWGGENVKQ